MEENLSLGNNYSYRRSTTLWQREYMLTLFQTTRQIVKKQRIKTSKGDTTVSRVSAVYLTSFYTPKSFCFLHLKRVQICRLRYTSSPSMWVSQTWLYSIYILGFKWQNSDFYLINFFALKMQNWDMRIEKKISWYANIPIVPLESKNFFFICITSNHAH